MFLAIRELLHAKFRYMLIGFIIVLTAGLIFIITGLANGLSADNASAVQTMQADYLVMNEEAKQQITKSKMPRSQLDAISDTANIENTAPLTIQMAQVSKANTDVKLEVAIFDTTKNMLMPDVFRGDMPAKENEIIADESLQEEGLSIGDKINFAGDNQDYTVAGFMQNQRFSHTPVIYRKKQHNSVNALAVQTTGEINDSIPDGLKVLTKQETLKGIPSYAQEQASLTMMIVFLFVITAFVLAAFLYVITLQKKSQFGVLKALGAKTSYLIKNVISQIIVISGICIAAAAGLTYGIKAFLPQDVPFSLTVTDVFQSAVLLLVVAVAGGLLSLLQVIKIDPITAIEGAE